MASSSSTILQKATSVINPKLAAAAATQQQIRRTVAANATTTTATTTTTTTIFSALTPGSLPTFTNRAVKLSSKFGSNSFICPTSGNALGVATGGTARSAMREALAEYKANGGAICSSGTTTTSTNANNTKNIAAIDDYALINISTVADPCCGTCAEFRCASVKIRGTNTAALIIRKFQPYFVARGSTNNSKSKNNKSSDEEYNFPVQAGDIYILASSKSPLCARYLVSQPQQICRLAFSCALSLAPPTPTATPTAITASNASTHTAASSRQVATAMLAEPLDIETLAEDILQNIERASSSSSSSNNAMTSDANAEHESDAVVLVGHVLGDAGAAAAAVATEANGGFQLRQPPETL